MVNEICPTRKVHNAPVWQRVNCRLDGGCVTGNAITVRFEIANIYTLQQSLLQATSVWYTGCRLT